ncbi:pirin family protein [Taibaiella lutea]|uniref:Pirin family protein n=1 Tax=Taibaiella lutea TaxID=2608001 RepID=A0A5M6CBF0_9BACT|nr:pirin family protein [Taibaiella lutea]KAA5532457.1 pirin family protein [Taibaiella lutea]
MENNEFIKKGLMGTGMFVAGKASDNVITNDIDELKQLESMDADHLPGKQTEANPNVVIHHAETRGHANHGWLDSYHSFSFANYYNPERMHFGVLRVLNDDRVDPGMGFGTHPHDNMEIISIPLEGDLEHKDSMGNTTVIRNGDIQAMSAGTGIFHSEYNKNKDKLTRFLQIWVFPNKKNVTPRYDHITLNLEDRHNKLQQILSPNADDEGVWIHQNAWFHLGKFDKDVNETYAVKSKGNGVYVFLLSGKMMIDGHEINTRDGIGIWDTEQIHISSLTPDAEVLLMEVPMSIG